MTLCWLKSPLQITFYHCPKTPKKVLALSDIVIIGYCDYYGFGCHSLSIRQAPHLCPARGRRRLWRPRCTLGRIPEREKALTHPLLFPPSHPSDVTSSEGESSIPTFGGAGFLERYRRPSRPALDLRLLPRKRDSRIGKIMFADVGNNGSDYFGAIAPLIYSLERGI